MQIDILENNLISELEKSQNHNEKKRSIQICGQYCTHSWGCHVENSLLLFFLYLSHFIKSFLGFSMSWHTMKCSNGTNAYIWEREKQTTERETYCGRAHIHTYIHKVLCAFVCVFALWFLYILTACWYCFCFSFFEPTKQSKNEIEWNKRMTYFNCVSLLAILLLLLRFRDEVEKEFICKGYKNKSYNLNPDMNRIESNVCVHVWVRWNIGNFKYNPANSNNTVLYSTNLYTIFISVGIFFAY